MISIAFEGFWKDSTWIRLMVFQWTWVCVKSNELGLRGKQSHLSSSRRTGNATASQRTDVVADTHFQSSYLHRRFAVRRMLPISVPKWFIFVTHIDTQNPSVTLQVGAKPQSWILRDKLLSHTIWDKSFIRIQKKEHSKLNTTPSRTWLPVELNSLFINRPMIQVWKGLEIIMLWLFHLYCLEKLTQT